MNLLHLFLPKKRIIVSRGDYHNGVARVACRDRRYNYVNGKGRFLFKEGFSQAEEFIGACAIADRLLLRCDGKILFSGRVKRLGGMESLFVAYEDSSYKESLCALFGSDGTQLTGFDYTHFTVNAEGTISASYTKKEFSAVGPRRVAKEENLWWCRLDPAGKELTPRLSFQKQMIDDSLCTCWVYNKGYECRCLYDIDKNVIVHKAICFFPETRQYRVTKVVSAEGEPTVYKCGIVDLQLNEIIPAQFDRIFPATHPHTAKPMGIGEKQPEGPFAQTELYIVKANNHYGLYDTSGDCLLEPLYKDIQSKSCSLFFLDSDKGIMAYDAADGKARLLVRHIASAPTGKDRTVYFKKRYHFYKSADEAFYFTLFRDPDSGRLGIVDDRRRVLLPPEFDDVDYNLAKGTVTLVRPDRTEEYSLPQLEQKWMESKPMLDMTRLPWDVSEEDVNARALRRDYQTVLFVDTETNGLPKDYKQPASDTDNWPRMLQISWIVTDRQGKEVKRRSLYIRPEGFKVLSKEQNPYAIPEEVLNKEGVALKDALGEFSADMEAADLVVGHNIRFDRNVIQAEQIRLGVQDAFAGKPVFCTMIAGKPVCRVPGKYGFKYPKLKELYFHFFNEDFEGAHDASNDVDATVKCFFRMCR